MYLVVWLSNQQDHRKPTSKPKAWGNNLAQNSAGEMEMARGPASIAVQPFPGFISSLKIIGWAK